LAWRDGLPVDRSVSQDTIADLIADPQLLVWVDLCGVDDAEVARIGEALHLDPHSLEDSLTPNERPKATHFDGYMFVTMYGASLGPDDSVASRVQLTRVSAYALPKCLLTVRLDDRFDMASVITRWQEDPKLVGFGVDGLLQGLLDEAIDEQFDVLQGLDDDAEELIDQAFADRADLKALQQRTFTVRRELVDLRRVIPPMRDVVAALMRTGSVERRWTTEMLAYYEDLTDHTLRATEWLDNLRDLVSSVFETNLALNDNRMNEAMKLLAGWAAIIAVPTLVTGFFGMNVPYFGFGAPAGLWLAAALIAVPVVGLFVVFRRKGWI